MGGSYHYHNGSIVSPQKKANEKYTRKNWRHWIDNDGDCQNERHEILIASSKIPVTFKTKKRCKVLSGKWWGFYTKKYYYKSSDLDIDHVVPLKEAYLSGGNNWTKKQKKDFANDHENLLAVSKKANRNKGAKDIAHWLPQESFICQYVDLWINIKNKYDLKMDNKEKNAIQKIKKSCSE